MRRARSSSTASMLITMFVYSKHMAMCPDGCRRMDLLRSRQIWHCWMSVCALSASSTLPLSWPFSLSR